MSVFYRKINWTCCSSGCSNSSGLLQWDGMLLTLYSVLWRHRAFTQRLSTQTSCVHADAFSDSDHLTLQINDAVLQNAQPDLIRLQNHPRLRFYASITWRRRTEPKSSGHPAQPVSGSETESKRSLTVLQWVMEQREGRWCCCAADEDGGSVGPLQLRHLHSLLSASSCCVQEPVVHSRPFKLDLLWRRRLMWGVVRWWCQCWSVIQGRVPQKYEAKNCSSSSGHLRLGPISSNSP